MTGTSETPLTLVTSTVFGIQYDDQGNELITLVVADTVQLQLPIDRRVEFDGSDRVFVQLINPAGAAEAAVDMRVLVDGSEVYRQQATLVDASLRFTYLLF